MQFYAGFYLYAYTVVVRLPSGHRQISYSE